MNNVAVLTSPDLKECEKYKYKNRIFLAGGISNCPDWQTELINRIQTKYFFDKNELLLINPRNPNFNKNATNEEVDAQVKWEYLHINKTATVLLFWFPKETVCPITLYESGKATKTHTNILVGAHPEYPRLSTLVSQLKLERQDIEIQIH